MPEDTCIKTMEDLINKDEDSKIFFKFCESVWVKGIKISGDVVIENGEVKKKKGEGSI